MRCTVRSARTLCLAVVAVTFLMLQTAGAETIARCGKGWLEEINGYPVLHLKGTPYEIGYQHGALLRESARQNLEHIVNGEGSRQLIEFGPIKVTPRDAILSILTIQRPHVPQKYFDELAGLAAGSGMELQDVQIGNFIPELFHCSGFALMNSATQDGTLYHGRVLDYATDWGLQNHAVIMVCEPEGGIPFVNVTYAGFIGSVTGMNAEHVSIGEMGGGGLGHWQGVPMAFLVREGLERGKTLDDVLTIFRENPRTCEYFYVVADAKTNEAVGMEASWDVMEVIRPGEAHPLLPSPVKDCALLSAGSRYEELVRRVEAGHGRFTAETAMKLMERPVAMKSNLHNVLFEPKTTRFWVANAGADGSPAAEQAYHAFQLSELLKRTPDDDAEVVPFRAAVKPGTPVSRATSRAPVTIGD
ncbi:MAG: C45 family autoproteolytic acyltransferase/hydrolase [Maioricimonas sp. JB045]